ncbi:hypothetical protein CYMTET_14386 [Cymbomonas tetramitiformis]|uniref:Uncharacterized protein n=1 Tax=Cymbomonas tetramitiformis TaxID=36881 RepID=A0AAE0GGK7_9CHLO|nr:hypothetical protein CYMTET_14386 [Cymbomonas tetramitiformis]
MDDDAFLAAVDAVEESPDSEEEEDDDVFWIRVDEDIACAAVAFVALPLGGPSAVANIPGVHVRSVQSDPRPELELSIAAVQSTEREARRLARERNSQRRITGYMSTGGSAPESSPSTPVSPSAAAAAASAAAAALAGGVAAPVPAASQFLFALDSLDDMDQNDRDSDALDKTDSELRYTGGKNEDRAAFSRRFVEMVGKEQRAHESRGSVRCAQPPFHEMQPGVTWAVCRRVQDGDVDGEVSDEWETEGTSTKGLTGTDGTEDAHYFWALRAFVAELEAKFLMKGTKEKEDLLVAKSQTPEQDGLAYVKICRRRESALNAGKMVEDSIVRQDIEECIKGLRIKEYRDRVSEQLRVSHPAPNKVTWENLEVIIEVQDKLKNDAEAWPGNEDAKKPPREANNAERNKSTYSKVPPPDAPKDGQCEYCFTRLYHTPDRCWTGCRDSRVPPGFHKDRQNSKYPNEVKNAQLRAYNIAHRFDKHKMGITTKEWLKLPEAKQQQQQVAASAEVKEKLAAELSGLQAAAPAKGGKSTEAQAQSEASDDEAEYHSNFNERTEYDVDECDCLADEGLGGSDRAGPSHAPELQARAAVALGNTQKMQGFKVKTPEEFDKAAQVPRAIPPNVLSRKFHLLASNLRSSMRTCSQIAAILLSQRAIDLPKGIENLLALEELEGNEPGDAVVQPTEVDEEMPLDEMPDGVVDSAAARCAAAACVSDLGVVDFSDHGHVRAGTINKTRAFDSLREKMKQHLTEDQTLLMAQVQPICKLQNATLYEGLALVSSGGELMLYRAILVDTGANCNIISIAVVRRLGLTVYEASTGAKLTRCDNSPTKFTHYCHVDVILAAGTPHMTLHRLHAFVTFEPENSWDLLIGTGPLKNSLMIDIKLGSGVAVSHAPSILAMDTQVVLPLVDMTPPKRPNQPRRVDPVVCLTTEIFGQDLVCEWPSYHPPSAEEERIAASGVRSEHIDDIDASPVPSPSSSPTEPGELPPAESEGALGQFCSHPIPWEGGRVRQFWDDWEGDVLPDHRWADQRLYRDRNAIARLCHIVKHPGQDMPDPPSDAHVCVEFARCREQKWVTKDQLKWPSWLDVDQKLHQEAGSDSWSFSDSYYATHIPSSASKRNVIYPRERHVTMLDTSMLKVLQDKVQALQKYPSGEVTGTLMWDLEKQVFCVQPDTAAQYLDLMRCTLDHAAVFNGEELLRELQFPHWYESVGVWEYQLLRYLQPVDMELLREGIYDTWCRNGRGRLPLELVQLDLNSKFYPVEDGLGGHGRVFADNASAQEYLHLGEARRMLKSVGTEQAGLTALSADAARRPPPPQAKRVAPRPSAPTAGAGPSRAGAGPSRARSPSRDRSTRPKSPPRVAPMHSPTPSPTSSVDIMVGNVRESSPPPALAASAGPSRAAAGPSRARSPSPSPTSNAGSWANSIRVKRGARSRSPGDAPPSPPYEPSTAQTPPLSPSLTGAPPSPSSVGSDWNAVRNATSVTGRSAHAFLDASEVENLKSRSNLTVFMVKYGMDRCRDRPVVFQLGACYARRGLQQRSRNEISNSVARRHDKTISCAQHGWHFPLGGQTTSSSLLGAVASAYADVVQLGRETQQALNCVGTLCAYVTHRSAHVLCCRENPNAKPVYYIFEDHDRCLPWHTQFTAEYLAKEDRKFTQMTWGSSLKAAPWVRPALEFLEERLFPTDPPHALQARVAERPEYVNEIDNRPSRQQRWPAGNMVVQGQRASAGARASAPSAGRRESTSRAMPTPQAPRPPANLTSQCPPSPASTCSALTERMVTEEEFEDHTRRARARFQRGLPRTAGGRPF